MTELHDRCLDTFPEWLKTLATDAQDLSALLVDGGVPDGARRLAAGGLNYLFKSLDLIPDGIDDIGYLDDAFVLRVAADLAKKEGIDGIDASKLTIAHRLVSEVDLVREFLGDDYKRLETYVVGLRRGAARGRSVDDILGSEATRGDFIADVRGFARSYATPTFGREQKNLIKLRAFFDAKLPR